MKKGMQRTFKIPNRNCRLIFYIPIPLSKGRFSFKDLPIFKLYNVKSPPYYKQLFSLLTLHCAVFNFDLNNCCYIIG